MILKVVLWGLLAASSAAASSAWARDDPSLEDRYRLAERFLYQNQERYVLNGRVTPHWIGGTDRFWYRRTDAAGEKQFVIVNAATGKRIAAFDHARIAASLARLLKRDVRPGALPFDIFTFENGGRDIGFVLDESTYRCRLEQSACVATDPALPPTTREVRSPDGKWFAFKKDHNLWLRPADAAAPAFALTTDGIAHYAYGEASGQNTHYVSDLRDDINQQPLLSWSPDSRRILTHRLDERQVRETYLVESAPPGEAGPKLWTYRAAQARDEHWPVTMPVVIDVATRRVTTVDLPPVRDELDSNIEQQFAFWSVDGANVYFVEREPYYKGIHFNRIDPASGKATRLVSEHAKTFVHIAEDYGWPKVRVLRDGSFIWYSERDNYGHLYRYDAAGRLKCRMTSGTWMVREIVRVDEAHGRVFFLGSGRDSRLDPYFMSLYSVGLNCRNLRRLTPDDAHHLIDFTPRAIPAYERASGLAPFEETNGISASNRYFVVNRSRPDQSPSTDLRRADGTLVATLEQGNISSLEARGFTLPERFSVVANDGKTRLYGTLFKPSYFDPARRYPIIDAVYLGPQVPRVVKDFTGSLFDWNSSATQTFAELGFIVMTLDGRGSPGKSKPDYDFAYGARFSGSGNLIDQVYAIRALATERPYIDLSRVGITGHSSGGYAAAHALLSYPDFFKVAVASSGLHDPFSYIPWITNYTGPDPDGKIERAISSYPLAGKLKGKLLLIHGEMDDNVNPSMTLGLAGALVEADRPFDMLLVPGANHDLNAFQGSLLKRRWDYFLQYLRDETPMPYRVADGPGRVGRPRSD